MSGDGSREALQTLRGTTRISVTVARWEKWKTKTEKYYCNLAERFINGGFVFKLISGNGMICIKLMTKGPLQMFWFSGPNHNNKEACKSSDGSHAS